MVEHRLTALCTMAAALLACGPTGGASHSSETPFLDGRAETTAAAQQGSPATNGTPDRIPQPAPEAASPPPGMVLIAGGTFTMGADDGAEDQRPAHQVTLSSYFIDRTEVTIEAYARCVSAGRCTEPVGEWCAWAAPDEPNRDSQPATCVDWEQSNTYCEFRGARLPTEAEWEYAARGTDGRRFPWGNQPPEAGLLRWDEPIDANACADEACVRLRERRRDPPDPPVAAFPAGASPFGVLDMAGSAWEWVADWYGPYPSGAVTNPAGPSEGERRITRGGSDTRRLEWLDARYRRAPPTSFRDTVTGFRCAQSVGS